MTDPIPYPNPPCQPPQPAAPASAVLDAKPQRIDGTGNRETLDGLFSGGGKQRGAWLSEGAWGWLVVRSRVSDVGDMGGWGASVQSTDIANALGAKHAHVRQTHAEDVDFITGGGPSEASAASGPTSEQQAQIQRRALIGGAATIGLVAFALVPTKDLRVKPGKPLYFYLTSLLGVQVGRLGCLHRGAGVAALCCCLDRSQAARISCSRRLATNLVPNPPSPD